MTRERQLQVCLKFLEHEVQSKKGLSGFAIRRAYQTLCTLKPNAAYRAIDVLLDEFWAEYQKIGPDPRILALAWLRIVDQKAARYQHKALFGLYQALRPHALEHIESAIPRLAQLLEPQ